MAFPSGPRRSLGRGVERGPVLRGERGRRRLRQGPGGPGQHDGLHRPQAGLRRRLLDGRRHGPLPRVPRGRRVRGGGALRFRSAARERRRLPAAAPHHGDLLPRQRGHAGAVRRRTICRGSRHAGHVPRRAGAPSRSGPRSTSAPGRRRRRTATDARPTRIARAASRSCCARSRAAARNRATPASPGRCSNGIRCRNRALTEP